MAHVSLLSLRWFYQVFLLLVTEVWSPGALGKFYISPYPKTQTHTEITSNVLVINSATWLQALLLVRLLLMHNANENGLKLLGTLCSVKRSCYSKLIGSIKVFSDFLWSFFVNIIRSHKSFWTDALRQAYSPRQTINIPMAIYIYFPVCAIWEPQVQAKWILFV